MAKVMIHFDMDKEISIYNVCIMFDLLFSFFYFEVGYVNKKDEASLSEKSSDPFCLFDQEVIMRNQTGFPSCFL